MLAVATAQKPKTMTAQSTQAAKKPPSASSPTATPKPMRKRPMVLPIWPELGKIIDIKVAIKATTNL